MEAQARQRLEKQIAKEEFFRQQEELKLKQEEEGRKSKEAYERQMREMEKKREAEQKKDEQREAAFREQEALKEEMRAKDLKKLDMMEKQRQEFQKSFMAKKEARDLRIIQSVANNQDSLLHETEQGMVDKGAARFRHRQGSRIPHVMRPCHTIELPVKRRIPR